jgi:hypothetical protein
VDKIVKDKASAPPRKDPASEANPTKAVNEKKKNNLTFMSVAKAPKRQREKGKVGDTVNRWDLGDKIVDESMPKGSLTINYRTRLWAHAAGWLQDEEEPRDDDEPSSEAVREDREYQEMLRKGAEDDSGRGKKRGAPSSAPQSAPKRAKVAASSSSASSKPKLARAPSAPRMEDMMEKLSEADSLETFFSTLAPVHERTLEDYQSVMDHLASKNVTDVRGMIEISDDDWISTYLPERMPPTAKRALRASITQSLIYIQSKKVFVDLTDD